MRYGMNDIVKRNAGGALMTAEQSDAIRTALKTSLYPGASDASVDMVLAYCKAAGYDPMKKPVHIVPMKVSTGRKDNNGYDIKETRDVIMPGIGQYRTDAVRTGEYAGCSEPEFGPTQVLQFKREKWVDRPTGSGRMKTLVDAELSYPEWCKITVTKVVDGKDRLFVAKEFWLENYAEKGDDGAPNSMWEKRPFAQLAKCVEAQALRKAFPENVGSQPTAEEMEGREVIDSTATVVPPSAPESKPADVPQLKPYTDEAFAKNLPQWHKIISDGKRTADDLIATVSSKGILSPEQIAAIKAGPAKPEDEPIDAEFTEQVPPSDDLPLAPEGGSAPNEYWDAATGEPRA